MSTSRWGRWGLLALGAVGLSGCPQTADEYLAEISRAGDGGVEDSPDIGPQVPSVIETRRASIPVEIPRGLAHDGTGLWMADALTGALVKVDPETGALLAEVPDLGREVFSLASVGGSLILATPDTLSRFDPESMTLEVLEAAPGLAAVARRGQGAVSWESQGMKLRQGEALVASVVINPQAARAPFVYLTNEDLYLVVKGPRRPGGADRRLVFEALDGAGQRAATAVGVVEAPVDVEQIVGLTLAPDRETVWALVGAAPATSALLAVRLGPLVPAAPALPEALAIVDVQVDGDTNGDGWLSPGERAEVSVEIFNGGAADFGRAQCLVGSQDRDLVVESTDNTLIFSSCAAGRSCGTSWFDVSVSPEAALGDVALSCVLIDDAEQVAELRFDLPIRAPDAIPLVGGVEVTSDSNGDGVLNYGEQATLRVSLRNAGLSTLTRSTCELSPAADSHTEAQISDDDLNYSDCQPGRSCGASSVDVLVRPFSGEGAHAARFDCALTDGLGDVHRVPIEVAVAPTTARPAVAAVEITADTDRDGVLEAGESATVAVTLRNDGAARLTRSACVVSSSTPWLTVGEVDERLNFAPCDGLSEGCGTSSFQAQASAEAPAGGQATLICPLEDEQRNVFTLEIALEIAL